MDYKIQHLCHASELPLSWISCPLTLKLKDRVYRALLMLQSCIYFIKKKINDNLKAPIKLYSAQTNKIMKEITYIHIFYFLQSIFLLSLEMLTSKSSSDSERPLGVISGFSIAKTRSVDIFESLGLWPLLWVVQNATGDVKGVSLSQWNVSTICISQPPLNYFSARGKDCMSKVRSVWDEMNSFMLSWLFHWLLFCRVWLLDFIRRSAEDLR